MPRSKRSSRERAIRRRLGRASRQDGETSVQQQQSETQGEPRATRHTSNVFDEPVRWFSEANRRLWRHFSRVPRSSSHGPEAL